MSETVVSSGNIALVTRILKMEAHSFSHFVQKMVFSILSGSGFFCHTKVLLMSRAYSRK